MAILDISPSAHVIPAIQLPSIDLAGFRPTGFSPIDAGTSLTHFAKIIRRQKWLILGCMFVAMVAAVALTFTLPKLYQGTATVKVDRHSAGGQDASQSSTIDDMDQIITTQMQLAASDPVLRPIAEKYHLLQEEHQLRRFFFWDISAGEARLKRAAPIELKRLKITRPPNTYLVNISYRAYDPQLAANVANDVATSLIAHANDTGGRSYVQVSALIASDMKDLRVKMNASARRLAQYEKDLNMVDPEQRTTVIDARLTQLNTEFTTAQAERLHKEAILDDVGKSHTLAAAQAAEAQGRSSLLDNNLERLDAARQQFAAARSYYGENHPEYRKAKEQVDELQAQVQRLQVGLGDKTAAEYAQALGREDRLRHVLDQTKAEADSTKERTIQYEQLKSEAETDKKLYQDLETRTREAEISNQLRDATIQIATEARPPDEQISPKLIVNVPVAMILSLVVGVFAALLRDAMDTTFSDAEDAASRLRVDVLAAIPGTRRLPPASRPDELLRISTDPARRRSAELAARYGQAIRALRNALATATLDRPLRSVLMTSANPSEGKSTTAINLAVASAQIGKKVLLLDADLRRPSLHKHFDLSCATGLSDVLARSVPIRDAIVQIDDLNLHVMPAGRTSGHAADLISMGFATTLEMLSRDFDLVIVDGPPMLGVAESQEMAGLVDGVLLLTKAGSTTGRAVADTLASLLRVRANILGVVMNQVKPSSCYGPYYYSTAASEPNTKSAHA